MATVIGGAIKGFMPRLASLRPMRDWGRCMGFQHPKKMVTLSRSSVGSVILALSPSIRRAGGPDGGTTMSYLVATPGIVQAAAADVASIGSPAGESSASARCHH